MKAEAERWRGNEELVHEGLRRKWQTELEILRNEGRGGEGGRHGGTLGRRESTWKYMRVEMLKEAARRRDWKKER